MRSPHTKIAWLIAVVAIIALNAVVFRAWSRAADPTVPALMIGAVPMLQILALGFVVRSTAPERRRFLNGFLTFGLLALAGYVALSVLFADDLIVPAIRFALEPLVAILREGPYLDTADLVFLYALGSLLMVLPQLLFALIGGLLSSALKNPHIAIEPNRR